MMWLQFVAAWALGAATVAQTIRAVADCMLEEERPGKTIDAIILVGFHVVFVGWVGGWLR